MLVFVTAVSVALVVSFVCSIFESVLLSINHAQVESLAREGKRSGMLLREFKRRIDVPIAAILIINTIAHTIGAAVAGASYEQVFDRSTLWIFSIVFTVAVLLFTEIIPKTLGVTHAARLAGPVAHGIKLLTVCLGPLVRLSEAISSRIRGGKELPVTSVEEIRLLAALGRSEGLVGARTAGIIVGATRLGQLRADDVMLPRQRVVFLTGQASQDEIVATMQQSGYSRFPFTPTRELDDTTGIVLARELLFRLHSNPGAPNRLAKRDPGAARRARDDAGERALADVSRGCEPYGVGRRRVWQHRRDRDARGRARGNRRRDHGRERSAAEGLVALARRIVASGRERRSQADLRVAGYRMGRETARQRPRAGSWARRSGACRWRAIGSSGANSRSRCCARAPCARSCSRSGRATCRLPKLARSLPQTSRARSAAR